MPADTTRNIPAAAFQLSIGEFTLGDNGEDAKTAPIRMVARSGKPIEHWYWGRIVHDLAGMKLYKPRIAIDYCHRQDEPIGYLNRFATDSGDLVCSGALVPYGESDRATEVIHKSQNGVPFEASINFGGDGIKIEELGEGQVSQVNGYVFEGPGVIVREWPLRGVAVCVYGADMHTNSEFSSSREVPVTVLDSKGNTNMSDAQPVEAGKAVETEKQTTPAEVGQPAVDAEQQTEEASEQAQSEAVEPVATRAGDTPPAEATEQSQAAPGKQFMEAFGEQQGALYFARGLSMEEAMRDHLQHQTDRIAELEGRLATSDRGADEPVEFQDGEKTRKPTGLSSLVRFGKK